MMRISTSMINESSIRNTTESQARLYKLQQQASTGKKYSVASEDPSSAVAAITLRSSLKSLESYTSTAASTKDWMTASEYVLQQMSDLGSRVESLISRGRNDTFGAQSRKDIGAELDGILESAVALANTKHQNRYIFAGFQTMTEPFARIPAHYPTPPALPQPPDPMLPESVGYSGDAGVIQRDIAPGQTMTVNIDGPASFNGLFASIIRARDAMNNNDTTEMTAAMTDNETAMDTLTASLTTIGSRLRNVDTAIDQMDQSTVEGKGLLSQYEDANMAEVISMLTQQETIYKSVIQVTGRANSMLNLFDTLR